MRTDQSSETQFTLQQWIPQDQYHKHQDRFDKNDEEIQGLLEEKHQNHKAYLSDTAQYLVRLPIQTYEGCSD